MSVEGETQTTDGRTNRELAEYAQSLAGQIGEAVETSRLGKASLRILIEELEAKAAAGRSGGEAAPEAPPSTDADAAGPPDAESPTDAPPAAEAKAPPEPPKAAARPNGRAPLPPFDGRSDGYPGGPPPKSKPQRPSVYDYSVAPGHAIACTSRGILGPGKEVRLSDFGADERVASQLLALHIEKGRVLRRAD